MNASTAVCPACGQLNDCARAAGTDAANCWCFALALTPERLARLRKKYPATACLCRRCLEQEQRANQGAGL